MCGAFLKLRIFLRPLLTVPPIWDSEMMLAVTDRGSMVKKEGVVRKATEVEVCLVNLGTSAIGEHAISFVLIENWEALVLVLHYYRCSARSRSLRAV